MNIIYHCYGSAHSSIVAAAIHLGHLPADRIPDYTEFVALPDFDVARNDSLGHLFYKGRDSDQNKVFTIGMGAESVLVRRSLAFFIEHSGQNPKRFYFAEALPHINRLAKMGGALSRRYGWVKLGRFMAAKGISQSYDQLLKLVEQTKKEVREQYTVD